MQPVQTVQQFLEAINDPLLVWKEDARENIIARPYIKVWHDDSKNERIEKEVIKKQEVKEGHAVPLKEGIHSSKTMYQLHQVTR